MSKTLNETAINDTLMNRNLTFSLGEEIYGFEIKYVRQIIGVQPITPIPDQPVYVKGVINLRGQIIPIIDIRLKFGREEKSYDDRTCIIILDINKVTVGIIVDSVSEVITITEENISIAPDFNSVQNRFIRGIGKVGEGVYILLNSAELILPESKYSA